MKSEKWGAIKMPEGWTISNLLYEEVDNTKVSLKLLWQAFNIIETICCSCQHE